MDARLVFLLGLPLAIFVHEMGHATFASLLSFSPRVISAGIGPALVRFRIFGATLRLRFFPLSGYTEMLPRPPGRRIQWAFVLAGGVIANLLAIFACASLSAVDLAGWTTMAAIAGANGAIIISALFPRRIRMDGVRVGSDGLQLAMLCLKPDQNSFARRLMEAATTAIPSTGGEYLHTLLGRVTPTSFETEWSQ